MTPTDLLHSILGAAADELERLTGRSAEPDATDESWRALELHLVWLAACNEATTAYDEWADHPGQDCYAVYRAAADRADTAQDHLAAHVTAHAHMEAGRRWDDLD